MHAREGTQNSLSWHTSQVTPAAVDTAVLWTCALCSGHAGHARWALACSWLWAVVWALRLETVCHHCTRCYSLVCMPSLATSLTMLLPYVVCNKSLGDVGLPLTLAFLLVLGLPGCSSDSTLLFGYEVAATASLPLFLGQSTCPSLTFSSAAACSHELELSSVTLPCVNSWCGFYAIIIFLIYVT